MFLGSPGCTFPFLPLPCAIKMSDGRRQEEKKEGKGGELMFLCQLTSGSISTVLGCPPNKQTVPASCILSHNFQIAA